MKKRMLSEFYVILILFSIPSLLWVLNYNGYIVSQMILSIPFLAMALVLRTHWFDQKSVNHKILLMILYLILALCSGPMYWIIIFILSDGGPIKF